MGGGDNDTFGNSNLRLRRAAHHPARLRRGGVPQDYHRAISLDGLIAESDQGKASLSSFQFLIFTFLIAGLFLMLTIESGGFVEIPEAVLGLLGISGGSYVVSKAVGSQEKNAQANAGAAKAQAEAGAAKAQADARVAIAQADADVKRTQIAAGQPVP